MNRIAAEIPMTIERLNQFLLSLSNLRAFDKPVPQTNVLQIAPKSQDCDDEESVEEEDSLEEDTESVESPKSATIRTDSQETDGSNGTDDDPGAFEESDGAMDVSWTGAHMPAEQLL